jgi:anthranilate synthase component 2
MLLLIDNYDSFTWNLAHYLGELGAEVVVRRNDALTPAEALAMGPEAIVLSPGPCDPDRAGICLDLIRENAGRTPMLGVCLGHQAIGQAYGGSVGRCAEVMHGKTSRLRHNGAGLFEGVPQDVTVTRYHSLEVRRDSWPNALEITAETESGVVMGCAHRELPVFGLQFHPESIASEHGKTMLGNFLALARAHALEAA